MCLQDVILPTSWQTESKHKCHFFLINYEWEFHLNQWNLANYWLLVRIFILEVLISLSVEKNFARFFANFRSQFDDLKKIVFLQIQTLHFNYWSSLQYLDLEIVLQVFFLLEQANSFAHSPLRKQRSFSDRRRSWTEKTELNSTLSIIVLLLSYSAPFWYFSLLFS